MFTLLEWGHARNEFSENVDDFETEDHMNTHWRVFVQRE